jgi:hypothetical protein
MLSTYFDHLLLASRKSKVELDSSHISDVPVVLANIYQPLVNICVWQRQLTKPVANYADWLIKGEINYELRIILESDSVIDSILKALPDHNGLRALAEDVNLLVTMFADLFELKMVGIRLSILDKAMCPKFHTDNLPCRLVTTYTGSGTEWLPEVAVDRSKLVRGANGLSDAISGVYLNQNSIQQLKTGDVALLKGSGWLGNEDKAIVHRSPQLDMNEKRLILTLDFGN